MRKLKRIYLPQGGGKKMAEVYGVHRNTITLALHGKLFSILSEEVREIALRDYKGSYTRPTKKLNA